jgi:hypothetical protein
MIRAMVLALVGVVFPAMWHQGDVTLLKHMPIFDRNAVRELHDEAKSDVSVSRVTIRKVVFVSQISCDVWMKPFREFGLDFRQRPSEHVAFEKVSAAANASGLPFHQFLVEISHRRGRRVLDKPECVMDSVVCINTDVSSWRLPRILEDKPDVNKRLSVWEQNEPDFSPGVGKVRAGLLVANLLSKVGRPFRFNPSLTKKKDTIKASYRGDAGEDNSPKSPERHAYLGLMIFGFLGCFNAGFHLIKYALTECGPDEFRASLIGYTAGLACMAAGGILFGYTLLSF